MHGTYGNIHESGPEPDIYPHPVYVRVTTRSTGVHKQDHVVEFAKRNISGGGSSGNYYTAGLFKNLKNMGTIPPKETHCSSIPQRKMPSSWPSGPIFSYIPVADILFVKTHRKQIKLFH